MRLMLAVEARTEIDDAERYYEGQQTGLGEHWLNELRMGLRRVRDQPRLYPRVRAEVRQFTLSRFPYKLLYSIESDHLFVIAVAHQRRRPDYWIDRLPNPTRDT